MRAPEDHRQPTTFPELNAVLEELVTSARSILSDNFVGAYLQGSFATGDADVHSDVDFLIVTEDEVTEEQLHALQAMHRRIYELDVEWAQHLEGSYVPSDELRRVDPSRKPLLFLDNGASELIRDNHCNTAVVRWLLREHGFALTGPDPRSLADPVPAEYLRREAMEGIREYVEWAPEPTKTRGMSRWKQPYLVLTYCRMLHTLETARVASKRDAGEWALIKLDSEWADLIQTAVDDRPDPWRRASQPADPEVSKRTLAFGDYVLKMAAAFNEANG